MNRLALIFFSLTIFLSACKKDEYSDPHPPDNVVTHYAYVQGVVLDSVSGVPVSNAQIFCSSSDLGFDSTDINGIYTVRLKWYTGVVHQGTEHLERPNDTTDFHADGLTSNKYGYVIADWGILIENDTITLPAIYIRTLGFITTHIKDAYSPANYLHLSWNKLVNGEDQDVYFHPGTDTTITWKAYPNSKTYYTWTSNDSITVGSGDTTFLNLYY